MKQNLAETNIFEEAKRRDILSLAKSLGLQFSSPKRSSCLNGCGSRNKASVSYYNNRFYCHNCNEGGSVIDLVMLAHGFSNIEAAEFLTERTRVKSFDYKKPTKSLSKQKVKLHLLEQHSNQWLLRRNQMNRYTINGVGGYMSIIPTFSLIVMLLLQQALLISLGKGKNVCGVVL